MKIKVKTPERMVLGFTRRELLIINNCLNEACNGLIMDRFIPARDALIKMMTSTSNICNAKEFYRINQITI